MTIESQIKNYQGLTLRKEKGVDYVDVPYKDSSISFRAKPFGPDTYANLDQQIKKAHLLRPTAAQTIALVHAAWHDPQGKYAQEIIQRLRERFFWAFNGLLYEPQDKGVYIQARPTLTKGRVIMDRNNLVKRLEAQDPSVRFVPFVDYKTGEHTPSALAENKFVQALATLEGAEKLAKIAETYPSEPRVYALTEDQVQEPTIRVAAFGSLWGGGRLDVDGGSLVGGAYGSASGVQPKTGEAGALSLVTPDATGRLSLSHERGALSLTDTTK